MAVSGTQLDALGTASGRTNDAPRPILGRPRQAKSEWEASKSMPRPLPRCFQTAPEGWLSMFSAKNTDERACGTIFLRFRFAAQKLEARNSCAHAVFREGRRKLTSNAKEGHKSSKIKAFRPPKSSLGASGRPKIEPEGARSSAETRSKRPRGLRKFICQRERASSSEKARPRAPEERAGPRALRGKISESSNGFPKTPF